MISFTVNYRLLLANAFFMLLIAAFTTRQPFLITLYIFVAIGIIASNVRVLSDMAGITRNMSIVLVIALTAMLPISLLRNETAIFHYLIVLASLGSAYVLTRNLYVYLSASRWSLIATQLLVLGYLYFSGLDDFPLENMLPDSSSNGITSYLIILQANYCIINFVLNRRTCLVTSLVTLLICIVGYGRGSILAAIPIFVFAAVFSIQSSSRMRHLVYGLLFLVVSLAGAMTFGREIIEFFESYTKIGSGLYDDARTMIIRDYLNQIDIFTFVMGVNYDGTSIEQYFYGNPHNSYIRAHHIFGIGYLLIMLLMPLVLLRSGHTGKVKIFCSLMILIVLFRSFTETIIFPTPFDFYYFSIIFILCTKPSAHILKKSGV